MKKITRTFALFLAAMMLTVITACTENSIPAASSGGESSEQEENVDLSTAAKNLDLSKIVVTKNEPKSGEWHSLRFDNVKPSKDAFSFMQEAAQAYQQHELKKENAVWIKYDQNPTIAPVTIPFDEIELFGGVPILRYADDAFYMEWNIANRFETYNKKSVQDILKVDFTLDWSWRPYLDKKGHHVKEYTLKADQPITDTYPLNGKQVSVDAALQYAEACLNGGTLTHITSPLYTYQPACAEVYSYGDEASCITFDFYPAYDDVPLNSVSVRLDDINPPICPFEPLFTLGMLTENTIDWIWSSGTGDRAPVSDEVVKPTISYEKACKILSETLSRDHKFTVKSARTIYCALRRSDYSKVIINQGMNLEPMWEFHITNVGVQEYSQIYAYINMVNGEIMLGYV